mmetsp:Transcript_11661/g.22452  ORF Transcript_11661/g.22452 Transcript_11661/m.22452 type:complete len:83 (+) Transcript_11661:122-370(+)
MYSYTNMNKKIALGARFSISIPVSAARVKKGRGCFVLSIGSSQKTQEPRAEISDALLISWKVVHVHNYQLARLDLYDRVEVE